MSTVRGEFSKLAGEPFRLFFVSGILWSIAGVSLWPLFYAGKLTGLLCGIAGTAMWLSPGWISTPASFRLAGLLLYQGLLLPPVLGIGSIVNPYGLWCRWND
jgi:hypothetical protein